MADLEFEPVTDTKDPALTDEQLTDCGPEPVGPTPAVPLRVQAGDRRFSPARPEVSWTGVCIVPPRTVMGLQVWSDTREFEVDGVPVSLFDIGKIIRMLLHQSGLAVETLAAGRRQIPDRWRQTGFEARRAVEWGITKNVLVHYRDAAAPFVREAGELDAQLVRHGEWLHRTRLLLTGVALTEGRVGVDMDYLLETTADDDLADVVGAVADQRDGSRQALVSAAAPLAERLHDADPDVLPESPDGYDALDQWLVDLRQHELVTSRC